MTRTVPNTMHDFQALYSVDGRSIDFVSDSFAAFCGCFSEDLRANPQLRFEFIHGDDRERVVNSFSTLVSSGVGFSTQYRIRKSDGSWRKVLEISGLVEGASGDRRIVTTIREIDAPISDRNQLLLQSQYALSTAPTSPKDSEERILHVLELFGAEFGWQICEVWHGSFDDKYLEVVHRWHDGGLQGVNHFIAASSGLALPKSHMPQGKVWLGGEPVWTKSVSESEPLVRRAAAAALNLQTSLWFPIKLDRECIGIVAAYSTIALTIDTEMLAFIDLFGAQLARFLTNSGQPPGRSSNEFPQMFANKEAAKLIIDSDSGIIVDANSAAAAFYLYPASQLNGMHICKLDAATGGNLDAQIRTAIRDEHPRMLSQHRLATGELRNVEVHLSSLRNDDKTLIYAIILDVTEKLRTEAALRDSESRYQSLFEHMLDGFAYYDVVLDAENQPVDFIFLEVNSAFESMTGLQKTEIIGRRVKDVPSTMMTSQEEWIVNYTQAVITGRSIRFAQHWQGSWYSVSAYSPKSGKFVTILEDITQRKLAEERLLESQRATSAVLANLPGMAYRCKNDHNWTMEFVSEGCLDLTGYSPEELVHNGNISFDQLIHPDDLEYVRREVKRAMKQNATYRLTYRILTHSGDLKWVWEQGNAIRARNNQCETLEGFISDITDRKRAEEALQSREEHFRALIDNSTDVVTLINANGMILYVSPSIDRVLGYTPDELIGTPLFDKLHFDDTERVRGEFDRMLTNTASDILVELRIRHKDGGWRAFESIGRNLIDNQHVRAIVVNSRDITERQLIETARVQLATAVEQATESIVITDLYGNIVYVNSAFEKVTGYLRSEAVGAHVRILKSGEHSPVFYDEIWSTLNSGEPWVGRFKNKRKNGNVYEEECTISPIKDSQGKTINFVAVKRDITKEVELEDRLRQAQKLEAVGRLASGIAHDFNNLLAGIRGFAELITQEDEVTERIMEFGVEIIKAASRAADLTGQLLAFARKGNYLSVPVDIRATIDEVTNILRHTIDRRIEIRSEHLAESSTVKGDPSQIQSAILNLGVNARDAMPNGGRLSFTTRNVALDTDYCRRHSLDYGAGSYLAITIADTGSGIEEDVLAHIFDPFFTTKDQGQGTGLGLAGVYGCVRNHHGSVEVVSEVGKGSAFTMYLPIHDSTTIVKQAETLGEIGEAQERILVVDDEDIVRTLAEKMLVKAGYKVIACKDGEEALQLYRTAIHAIDLVLLDMMMPKMNGRDTFVALKKFNPRVRVLLMSGFSDQDVQEILDQGMVGFVQKPFQMKVFLSKVRDALDQKMPVKAI